MRFALFVFGLFLLASVSISFAQTQTYFVEFVDQSPELESSQTLRIQSMNQMSRQDIREVALSRLVDDEVRDTRSGDMRVQHSQIEESSLTIRHVYERYGNMIAMDLTPEQKSQLLDSELVTRITKSLPVQAFLSDTIDLLDIPAIWALEINGEPVVGSQVTIAVIDTGIDYTHSAFGNCERTANISDGSCSRVIGGYNYIDGNDDPFDDNGHGTHVAAIVGGNWAQPGVAPGVDFLAYKVLNSTGGGDFNDVVAAIERAVEDGADILVLSLGAYCVNGYNGSCGPEDVVSQLVNNATLLDNVSVVVAAGNCGGSQSTQCPDIYGDRSIATPGAAKHALTVGSITKSNTISGFSSRGPVEWTNASGEQNMTKPNIVSYGSSISAACSSEDTFCPPIPNANISKSGTSMAAPHVAGAVALIRQVAPALSSVQINELLTSTAQDLGYDNNTQGMGMLNITRALGEIIPIELDIMVYENETAVLANISVNGTNLQNYTFLFAPNASAQFVQITNNTDPIENEQVFSLLKTDIEDGQTLHFELTAFNVQEQQFSLIQNYTYYEAPLITVHSPINQTIYEASPIVNVSVTSASEIDEIWFLHNGTNMSYNDSPNYTFSQGIHNITVFANNTFGQQSSVFIEFTVNDTLAPRLTIHSPLNTTYHVSQIPINISAIDPHLDQIWFFNGTHNVTYEDPITLYFSDGVHTLIAYANDTFGNTNQTNVTFTVDTTPPVITLESANLTNASKPLYYLHASTNRNLTQANITYFNKTYPALINETNVTYPLYVPVFNESFSVQISVQDVFNRTAQKNVSLQVNFNGTINGSVFGDAFSIASDVEVSVNVTNQTDVQPIRINRMQTNRSIVEFSHNFTQGSLFLNAIRIRVDEQENASRVLVSGVNKTKTVYLELQGNTSRFSSICVVDRLEFDFVSDCPLYVDKFPNSTGSYNFTRDNQTIRLEGLQHSQVQQVCTESWSCVEWSSCSSSGEQTCDVYDDANSCGTTHNQPVLTQSCTPPSQDPGNGGGDSPGGPGSSGFVPASAPSTQEQTQQTVETPSQNQTFEEEPQEDSRDQQEQQPAQEAQPAVQQGELTTPAPPVSFWIFFGIATLVSAVIVGFILRHRREKYI